MVLVQKGNCQADRKAQLHIPFRLATIQNPAATAGLS